MREAQNFFPHPPRRFPRGKILVQIQNIWLLVYFNYHANNTLSLLQTKLAEKKQQTNFFIPFTLQIQI